MCIGLSAQRIALPALGAADGVAVRQEKGWLRRKSRKIPQNPQRQVHALLGVLLWTFIIDVNIV